MSHYFPDRWVIVKVQESGEPNAIYKVFASWRGSYSDSDRWKMNSGCVKVTEGDDQYHFFGYSGSVYSCAKDRYGYATGWAKNVLEQSMAARGKDVTITVMPEDTDFAADGLINRGE